MKLLHITTACLFLSGCAGAPDRFGIEDPGFGVGDVPKIEHQISQAELVTYCVSINGRLFDHGRACAATDYTLNREVMNVATWCLLAHVDMEAPELAAVDRYASAVCSGWHPLAL